MANNVFGALNLKAIDGSGALDQIDGSILMDGDIALVVNNVNAYIYKLSDNDNTVENLPYVIKPILNGTNKRWKLKSFGEAASDLTILGKLITDMISFSGDSLTIKAGNHTIATFSAASNSVSFERISSVGNSTMVTGLNAEFVGGKSGELMMLSDGSVSFLNAIQGQDPYLPQHLATKNYVDQVFSALTDTVTNFTVTNLLTAGTIASETSEDLVLKRGNDTVATFGSNGVIFSKIASIVDSTMVNGLNAEFIGGVAYSNVMKKDGTAAFTGAVAGVTPTLNSHLTTKAYVDSLVGGPSAATLAREAGGTAYKNFLNINSTPSLELKAANYINTINGAPAGFTFSRASVATAYGPDGFLKTYNANELRHEWDPVTGEYKGWLLEGQSTNRLLYSEDFLNAAWVFAGTETSNTTIAPDGTTTADTIVLDSTNNQIYQTSTTAAADGTPATFSVWMKLLSGGPQVRLAINRVGNNDTEFIDVTLTSQWQRFVISHSATWTGTTNMSVAINRKTVDCEFAIWGAQLETQYTESSYIKTTSTIATRQPDCLTLATSMFPFNGNEGTVFITGDSTRTESSAGFGNFISLNNGADINNRIILYYQENGNVAVGLVNNSGVTQYQPTSTSCTPSISPDKNVMINMALGYKTDDFGFSINGAVSSPDTSGSLPTVNTLCIGGTYIGTTTPSQPLYGHIKHVLYFPRRLSDAELQSLTS